MQEPACLGLRTLMDRALMVEARKLEHHSPPTLKVKYKGS